MPRCWHCSDLSAPGAAEPIGHQSSEVRRLQRAVQDHARQPDAESEVLVVVNLAKVAGTRLRT